MGDRKEGGDNDWRERGRGGGSAKQRQRELMS